MASPLTTKQKTTLAMMARQAWLKHHNSGATEEPFPDWRAREAEAACGHRISAAPKSAFNDLYAHFTMLRGDAGKAYDRLTGPSNEEHQMRHLISVAAKALGLPISYADTKSRNQLKGILINLTRQLRAAKRAAKDQPNPDTATYDQDASNNPF